MKRPGGVEKMYTSVHTLVNLSDVTQAEIMLRQVNVKVVFMLGLVELCHKIQLKLSYHCIVGI